MKKSEIFSITKEQIEKQVREQTKRRKSIKRDAFTVRTDYFLGASSILAETVKKRIDDYMSQAATLLSCEKSKIRIRYTDWGGNSLTFYVLNSETEFDYENRINVEVRNKWKNILTERQKIKRKEQEEQNKKRQAAIAAIEFLGEEVYDVFKDLQNGKEITKTKI
jgi:hypothetical protein